MSTSIIDKENSAGLYHAQHTNSRKFGDSIGGSSFNKIYSTPQHKLKSNINLDLKSNSIHKLKENNNEKRRALGDLLNTTKSNRQSLVNFNTPKSNLLQQKFNTPSNKCIKKLTRDFERQSLGSELKSEREIEQENYPAVEKLIKNVDTFDDLFEDGKISDILTNKNVTYVPRLPSAGASFGEEIEIFKDFEIYTDKKFESEIKEVNKSIKNQLKKEKNEFFDIHHEMPSLDLPAIEESFDVTLDDSFDD